MSDLRLTLDTRDYSALVEIGRSLIPTLAPGWTDHNVHDPGIMLMELVAWIADAQTYALARSSRGEREAYGHLLGLRLTGPSPAQGLIWPLVSDAPAGTPTPWAAGVTLDAGSAALPQRQDAPPFYTTSRVELTTAVLTKVATVFADGSTRDWTRANVQQGATFLPFGQNPQKGDRLQLTLEGALIAAPATGAGISIGFEIISDAAAAPPVAGVTGGAIKPCQPVQLRVALSDGVAPWPISIQQDTTNGLAQSGALLLAIDPGLAGKAGTFTLSIGSDDGFLIPPRVQRLALNVLPVNQVQLVSATQDPFGTDLPDQACQLDPPKPPNSLTPPGLIYPVDDSFTVMVANGSTLEPWARTGDLSSEGPDAKVYALDEVNGIVTFGNGINGRPPARGAALHVEYHVTAGAGGNLPRGVQWKVAGVAGAFGVNSDPTTGGSSAVGLDGLRAIARQRVHSVRPIVTTDDLEQAAVAFADLDVRRARELVPDTGSRRVAGSRVLVAVGPHDLDPASDTFEESALWLGEIRRRLVPRLPLGQRLEVIAPRLVDVHVVTHLVAAPQLDPADVQKAVEQALLAKFKITTTDGSLVWPFGRDITALTVKGWLRNVDGVSHVTDASLQGPAASAAGDRVALGITGLPHLVIAAGDIVVAQSKIGGAA
jgi:hypothetical protein